MSKRLLTLCIIQGFPLSLLIVALTSVLFDRQGIFQVTLSKIEIPESTCLDGEMNFTFCASRSQLSTQVTAKELYSLCSKARKSPATTWNDTGETQLVRGVSRLKAYTSTCFRRHAHGASHGKRLLWCFPKYIGLGPSTSGSSALQAYLMSHSNYFNHCPTRGLHRCTNTKKEVKFWNRGRGLERTVEGRKYCYFPHFSCYLLRTDREHFSRRHFWGEITVSLLWHLKSPEYVQQYAPADVKIIMVLRDPTSRYVAVLRKSGLSRDDATKRFHREKTEWNNCLRKHTPVLCAYKMAFNNSLVSSMYVWFLYNWLSYLPLEHFIFVAASALRCNRVRVMREIFDALEVHGPFDTSLLSSEININLNRIDSNTTTKGYGGSSRRTTKKNTTTCEPYSNTRWFNTSIRKDIASAFNPSVKLLGILLGKEVDELF